MYIAQAYRLDHPCAGGIVSKRAESVYYYGMLNFSQTCSTIIELLAPKSRLVFDLIVLPLIS